MYLGKIVIPETLSTNTIPNNIEQVLIKDYKETDEPTLIVGWENTKELYPNTSILNKEIKNNLYWTFGPREKRGIFETDVKSFIEKVNKDLYNNLEQVNIDPLLYNIEDENTLIKRINKFSGSFGYLYVNKFYFYRDNKIYHIDFDLLDFIGFDTDKIKAFLNDNFEMINDVDYGDIEVKYIPYVYSKDAEKNDTIRDVH
jgi:hypothetical protein